jgi:hypothetical protein
MDVQRTSSITARKKKCKHTLRSGLLRASEKLAGQAKTLCYDAPLMLMQRKSAFSRRLPDLVTEELVAVLTKKSSFEFKQLFDVVHERLRARNAASGGEEMLRLRAYEKLQNLVSRGMVKKTGKKYKGLASLAKALTPAEPIPVGK